MRIAGELLNRLIGRWGWELHRKPGPPPDIARDRNFMAAYQRCAPWTMTSIERMYSLWQAVQRVMRTGVPGDFVECGVAKGGSCMLMALAARDAGEERRIWMYDTYQGFTGVTIEERDRDLNGRSMRAALAEASDYGSEALVRCNMNSVATDYRIVRGLVEETIPAIVPAQIALLRLDTDLYASTAHELRHLYPRLASGGILIIDDYGGYPDAAGAAVDEFFGGSAFLHRIDYTGRLVTKGEASACRIG